MISDFETACFRQKIDFRNGQKDLKALAPCALKSSESFLCLNTLLLYILS
jgi:hypothetical protein